MTWVPPVRSVITSPWGPRDTKIPGASTFHRGTDLRAPTGTPIVAPAAGTVTRSTWAPIRGHVVEIDHGDQITTRHQHLSRRDVARGQQVTPGQTIGAAGATGGLKIAAHLHTEVLLGGVQIDPEPFYAARGAALGLTPRSWFDMATEKELQAIVRTEVAAAVQQITAAIADAATQAHVLIYRGASGQIVMVRGDGVRTFTPAEWAIYNRNLGYRIDRDNLTAAELAAVIATNGGTRK